MSRSIAVPLPRGHHPGLLGDLLMQMAYCDPAIERFSFTDRDTAITVTLPDGAPVDDVERKVRTLVSRVFAPSRAVATLVREHVVDPPRNMVDVAPDLERRGWVVPAGPGLFHLRGPALALFDYFDSRFLAMAREESAAQEQYPPMIGADSLRRLGFFESTPQYATFAQHLREDVDTIDYVMARMQAGEALQQQSHLAELAFVLASTVCAHTFAGRADTVLEALEIVTARNVCTRYEGRNLAHLDRLWTFNMREVVFLAPDASAAEAGRARLLERTEAFLREHELAYRVERANDLFFSPDAAKRVSFQQGLGLKLELRVLVPPRASSVACASFNLHHTNFGRRMGITSVGGGPIHSSCVGYGIERWVYCFLQQHGTSKERWPATVREALDG